MPNVYSLTFYHTLDGYRQGFFIGLFRTRETAAAEEAHYRRNIRGFKDYPCEAEIKELPIIGAGEAKIWSVYCFTGWNLDEYGDEVDILESPCYADREDAGAALQQAKLATPRQEWILDCYPIGMRHWLQGFTMDGNIASRNRCYTYFRICGDFDPDEITEILGLTPTRTWKAGDKRRHKGTYAFSNWEFGRCDDYDPCVEEQMRKTIAPLLDKIDLLNRVRNTYDVEFSLQIVPTVYAGDPSPCLGPPLDVIDFCHATRTGIDIDLYINDSTDD